MSFFFADGLKSSFSLFCIAIKLQKHKLVLSIGVKLVKC